MYSFQFDPSAVAIVTTTSYPKWYRGKLRSIRHTDKVRGDLVLQLVLEARKRRYQIVVADGKSTRTFRQELSKIDGAIIIKRRSPKRSASKRQALKKAIKLPTIKVIVMTEPEKVSFITDCILQVVKPILSEEADIVVPKRQDKLFKKTYPDYQYESESEANKLYNEVLRANGFLLKRSENLDMFFGPRVLPNNPKIIKLFTKRYLLNTRNVSLEEDYFDIEEYSNIGYFPIVIALKKGLRVKSIVVPFSYPKAQKKNEEVSKELFHKKRKTQRLALLSELLHFVDALH